MEFSGAMDGESSTDPATASAPALTVAPERSALHMLAQAHAAAAADDDDDDATGTDGQMTAAVDKLGEVGDGGELATAGADTTEDGHYPLEEEADPAPSVAAATTASIAEASLNPPPPAVAAAAAADTGAAAASTSGVGETAAASPPNGDDDGSWTTPNPAHPRKAKAGPATNPESEPEWEVGGFAPVPYPHPDTRAATPCSHRARGRT